MNIGTYLNRSDVLTQYPKGSWQNVVFSEFAMTLESPNRPFPCVFGVQGYRDDQLRYIFQESFDAALFAKALEAFVKHSRSYGPNTSLVLFLKPQEIETLDSYRNRFWAMLADLAAVDHHPWPTHIPVELEHREWEFCFAGEPIFVVCNNPAHALRQSRRSTGMMLTFQPRWVFDKILGTERSAERSFASVRERLESYDLTPISPVLGRYGDETIREYQQYFLDERNEPARCPYTVMMKRNSEVAA